MIILYLYDNIIEAKEKEEIKEHFFPKAAMEYGKVKNIPMFEMHLRTIAKKEKWISFIVSKKIIIILPNYYNECDKEIINVIFENVGFSNLKYVKENSLISLKKNNILINLHNDYLVMTYQTKSALKSKLIPYYIFGNLEKTVEFILKKDSKKTRYFFIGNNEKIPFIVDSKKQQNIYYYLDHQNYIIKQFSP